MKPSQTRSKSVTFIAFAVFLLACQQFLGAWSIWQRQDWYLQFPPRIGWQFLLALNLFLGTICLTGAFFLYQQSKRSLQIAILLAVLYSLTWWATRLFLQTAEYPQQVRGWDILISLLGWLGGGAILARALGKIKKFTAVESALPL